MWKSNNTLLNDKWVKEEIQRGVSKYPERNENKNTTCQHLRNAAKAVLRAKL